MRGSQRGWKKLRISFASKVPFKSETGKPICKFCLAEDWDSGAPGSESKRFASPFKTMNFGQRKDLF
jgi:hypothetical protein